MNKALILALAATCLVVAPAAAKPPAPDAKALITPAIRQSVSEWLNNEVVLLSIRSQNKRYQKLNNGDILKLDKQWRDERTKDDMPLIAATLSNPLSVYLSRVQGRSLGLYSEIFIMDNKGLNVGQSSITSDFWQGDEAKFQKTYEVGVGAMFIDDPEWDDNLGIWKSQLNLALTDKDGSTLIGAATIEINLTELARRQAQTN